MMGAAIMLALIMGGIGGVINGKYRVNLLIGLVAIVGMYLCVSYFLGLFLVVTVGVLPLTLAFVSSSITVQYSVSRYHLNSVLSILVGLGAAIATGVLFILLGRARLYPFEHHLWVTAGVMVSVISFCALKMYGAQQGASPDSERRRG